MSKQSSLHQWLKAEESAGTLDSQGHFTLEQGKAWEKLGAFQLPYPEAWVLKLVQAAMASDQTTLAIEQSREETIFSFRDSPNWQRSEVEAAVFDPATKGCDETGHLAIALRALALLKDRPFSVQYSDGEHWAWTGKAFAQIAPKGQGSEFVVSIANYQFGQSSSFFSLSNQSAARFRAAVTTTLSERCHLCPRPLTLDGRDINAYEADPMFGVGSRSNPLLIVKTPVSDDWRALRIAGKVATRPAKVGAYKVSITKPLALTQTDPDEFGAAGILSVFFQEQVVTETLRLERAVHVPMTLASQILWVSDGVVVKRESLGFNGYLGLGAIVSANGLDTDITGLSPLENDERKARLTRSLSMLEQTLSKLSQELGSNGFQVSGNKMETALKGIAGTALLLAVPVIGIALLTRAGFDYRQSNREGKQLNQAYRDDFINLIEFLRQKVRDVDS